MYPGPDMHVLPLMNGVSNLLAADVMLFINIDFLYRFYPGVPDALKFASSQLYIVTTKQVLPLLHKNCYNIDLQTSHNIAILHYLNFWQNYYLRWSIFARCPYYKALMNSLSNTALCNSVEDHMHRTCMMLYTTLISRTYLYLMALEKFIWLVHLPIYIDYIKFNLAVHSDTLRILIYPHFYNFVHK